MEQRKTSAVCTSLRRDKMEKYKTAEEFTVLGMCHLPPGEGSS